MKLKILLFSVCFLANFFISFSQFNFQVIPFSIKTSAKKIGNIVQAGNNLLTYGKKSSYLISNDKGLNWQSKQLDGKGDIMEMIFVNQELIAISELGYLSISKDFGESFTTKKLNLQDEEFALALASDGEFIFVRTNKKIVKINKSFEVKKIFLTGNYKEPYTETFNSQTSWILNGIFDFYDNKLTFAVSSLDTNLRDYYLLRFDNDLNILDSIRWHSQNICDRCYISSISNYKNHFLMSMDAKNWEMDSFDSIPKLFTKNIVLNKEDPSEYFKNLIDFISINSIYKIKLENKLYNLYKYNDLKDSMEWLANEMNPQTYFYQINGFKHLNIVEDSIMINFDENNTILRSSNYGKQWDLRSFFKGKVVGIYNDSCYCALDLNGDDKFFLPMNSYNSGKSFIIPKAKSDNELNEFNKLFTVSNYYFDDSGFSFINGSSKTDSTNNMLISYDMGKNWEMKRKKTIKTHFAAKGTNILKIDTNFVWIYSNIDFYLQMIDTKFVTEYQGAKDTLFIPNVLCGNKLNELFLFGESLPKNQPRKKQIRQTTNLGQTWEILYEFPQLFSKVCQTLPLNQDTIIFITQSPNRVYMFDAISKKIDTLWKGDNIFYDNMFFIRLSNTNYLLGDRLVLINKNNDLHTWEKVQWKDGDPYFYSAFSKGNVAFVEFEDDLHDRNYYKITKEDLLSNIENEVEVRYTKDFYAYPPRPLPAQNHVSIKVFLGIENKITSPIKVYDIYGSELSQSTQISYTVLDDRYIQIDWECSNVQSGVYIIQCDSEKESNIIRVLKSN